MLKKIKYLLISLVILVLNPLIVQANQVSDQPVTRAETYLDTVIQLSVYHEPEIADPAIDEAVEYIQKMENLLSAHIDSSQTSLINQNAGKEPVKVDPEVFQVLEASKEYGQITKKTFDVTIGPIARLWNIGSQDARVPKDEEIKEKLQLVNLDELILDSKNQTAFLKEKGMQLDLGAIAKGYIADGVKEIFDQHDIKSAIINLGGNVVVMGTSPKSDEGWNVGVQNPDQVRGDVVGAYRVKDGSIVTSGIYERYLEEDGKIYHHILNPETGYPVENDLVAVTIFSKTSLEGDGLSTGIFALGLEEGMELIESLENVEAVFITKDHQVVPSSGLSDFEVTNENYQLTSLEEALAK